MKTTYRHRLKTNEVASAMERAIQSVVANQQRVLALVALVAIVAVAFGAYLYMRARTNAAVGALVGQAMLTLEAPVAPPPPPGQPATPGSYPTEQARLEAALETFLEAADGYPNTNGGLLARYQAASVLAALDRPDEAVERFQEVMERADRDSLYYEMAQLGRVSAQAQAAQYDLAIATLEELSGRTDGEIPPDAMLMQLGRVHLLAGNTDQARQVFQRLLDEYPESQFAADAQREFDVLSLAS